MLFIYLLPIAFAWNYGEEGRDWDDLCQNGASQSPIDINPYIATNITATSSSYWFLSLDYSNTWVYNSNSSSSLTGFTYNIDLNFHIIADFGQVKIKPSGLVYKTKSISFHSPSEHTIDGQRFPLELQITHKTEKETLILVILYKYSANSNRLLDEVISAFGSMLGNDIDLKNAIDGWFAIKDFYYYNGSLTVPPCEENIFYVVYEKVMPASVSQIEYFKNIVSGNSRSVMPQNSRKLEHYKGLEDKEGFGMYLGMMVLVNFILF
jgi:carbonic anhydrase